MVPGRTAFGMLREGAELYRLSAQVTAVLADTNRGRAGVVHSGAVIGNVSSAPPPRLPRFGGWSMRPSARHSGCPRTLGPAVPAGAAPRCRSVAAPGCRCHSAATSASRAADHHYLPDNKQDAMEILNTT